MMMKHQRGMALSGLISWGVILFLLAILGMKVVPEYIEYYKVKKVVAATAYNAGGRTVPEIRESFNRYANIDQIDDKFKPEELLEITKEGGRVVISFYYERRVPLVGNANLLFEFQGRSVEGAARVD